MKDIKNKKLWTGIVILIILSPLGLIIPGIFKAGSAWGEWSAGEIKNIVGYVPEGFEKLSSLWKAPFSDYSISGWNGKFKMWLAYIISAIVGVGIITGLSFLLGKILPGSKRRSKNGNSTLAK